MSKRPRTESPHSQEDIWGDDFTYDEVTSIVNIETLASQSHFPIQSGNPINLNNASNQKDNQMREGEIKNLKMKIKQLEIQLSNTKQEEDDKFKSMKKMIDCKDTELQFQKQELTALKNKIKEININVSKIIPQKNLSFGCMRTGSNSKLLHSASEHSANVKKNMSTQTSQNITNYNTTVRGNYPEMNKPYEQLKKCLYPDLMDSPNKNPNINGLKKLSTIQECHLILAKLTVIEASNENQSYSLIKLLFENCKHIIESIIDTIQETMDNSDFVKREKQLVYCYLNLNKPNSSMFDQQFSHLLECISELTIISSLVPKIVMNHVDIFQTFVEFLQLIGLQSRILEYVSVIKALIKFLTNLCDYNHEIPNQKQLEIVDIIKEIVFCRPCIDIVQELIHLLSKISTYPVIIDNLCQSSCSETFISSARVTTFTTGTCVLRVLCLQLKLLKHNYHLITNYLYFVNTLLNCTHIPKWMYKTPSKTCDCTSSFIELTIQFLYTVFKSYEKENECFDSYLLKSTEEIIENSSSILYRMGKLDEDFRSHISKCRGRYDVIIQKIQKFEIGKSNKFLTKEFKKFEFKSSTHSQFSSSMTYQVFPIDVSKFTEKSQFDEPNKQLCETTTHNT